VRPLEGLQALIIEFGISVDSLSAHQLTKYLALLEKWNACINLTANTEWQAVEPLFREGIWASKMYPGKVENHLDIGTGAGFPAIVLKIMHPHMQLEMVESRTRKSAFLETAVHELKLKEAYVRINRLDAYLQNLEAGKCWDCISWKGLKLSSSDLFKLKKRAHSGTQFWMFHGQEPAVDDPEALERFFTLLRSEKLPTMKEWHLSIYLADVSRETG
jgi:16S rRNA (guanine(527)-N(7))-methyltransferase RsmG